MTRPQNKFVLVLAALLLAPLLVAPTCDDLQPRIIIDSPVNGAFTPTGLMPVTGRVLNLAPTAPFALEVNGVPTEVVDGEFAVTIPLDAREYVQPIVAQSVLASGELARDRVTVIYGDSIPPDGRSLNGFALRVRNSGLTDIEPVIENLIGLDPAVFVPPGAKVISDFCYLRGPLFGVCLGSVDATVASFPPPSMAGLSANVRSQQGALYVDVEIRGLDLRANARDASGIPLSCAVDIYSDVTRIQGSFALDPTPTGGVDGRQLGSVSVQMGNFSYDTDCAGLLGGLYEVFIDLIITDIKNDFVLPGIRTYLNQVRNGDTVIADALEFALDGLDINGTVSEAIGAQLEAPITFIAEDTTGFTVGADALISTSMPDPNAAVQLGSLHVDEPFPTFSSVAPNGQPYELGMGISASAFNQLLRALIESGLLITTVREIDFLGQTGVQVTAGDLAFVFPEFKELDPTDKIRFDVYPTIAPFVTGETGPLGELATITIPHLLLNIVTESNDEVVLQAAVDAKLGFDAAFENGILNILMAAPQDGDLRFTILDNPLGVDEEVVNTIFPTVAAPLIPTLASALGSFPLPDFLGLQLELVDLTRNGEYMSLFFNLSTGP